jgi:hypothetical protein
MKPEDLAHSSIKLRRNHTIAEPRGNRKVRPFAGKQSG